MPIEATFQALTANFEALREAMASLRLTVVEDRPPRNEVLLVERLGDAVMTGPTGNNLRDLRILLAY